MSDDKPAFLWADGHHVILTPRGAQMCYAALVAAERKLGHRNGGSPTSDALSWLTGVLRLATMDPARLEPESYGRKVEVTVSARREIGSGEGSAVADEGSEGSMSTAVGARGSLDTRSAAALLGISDRAVRKACDRGWLRAERVSGHWLIDEADALAYRGRRRGRTDERQAAVAG